MSGTATVKALLQSTPYQVSLSDDLGHAWLADEPTGAGGGNAGPTPERLVLASLGACTAITVKMVAVRRQWPLAEVQVELQLNPAGKPEAGTDIVRRVALVGDLTDDQRSQLLKIANACPMHRLLTGDVRIHSSLV